MAKQYNSHEVHPVTYFFVGMLILITFVGLSSTLNKTSQPQTFKSLATGTDCSNNIHCRPLGLDYICSGGFCVRGPNTPTPIWSCARYDESCTTKACCTAQGLICRNISGVNKCIVRPTNTPSPTLPIVQYCARYGGCSRIDETITSRCTGDRFCRTVRTWLGNCSMNGCNWRILSVRSVCGEPGADSRCNDGKRCSSDSQCPSADWKCVDPDTIYSSCVLRNQ